MVQLSFELPNGLAAKLRNVTSNKKALTDQVIEFTLLKYFEHNVIGQHPQRRRLERAPVNMAVSYSIESRVLLE